METICFFSGDITRSGGTERVSTMIANALAAEKRYRILFLSLTEQRASLFFPLAEEIEHYALGETWIEPGPGYLKIIPKLYRFLKSQRVDVIIDIDIVLDVLSLPAVKMGLRTRVISWEHFNYQYESGILYRKLIRSCFTRYTDYIVTLTERDEESYRSCLRRLKRIRAIPNPIEKVSVTEEKREKWILTAGNVIYRKGSDFLARIAPAVLKKHPEWKWFVLGDGELRGMLEEVREREGLQDQLFLPGRVENVADYMRKAQIYVLLSRVEGLPMVLLEAKAWHLPCVSFDIMTGPSEIIQDKINGYLVPPFDCDGMAERIGQLIEDEALRNTFRKNAGRGMEKFQKETILRQWNEVIEQVVGRKKPDNGK